MGLAMERERQRIGKGRSDGLGVGKPRNRWSEEVCGRSVVSLWQIGGLKKVSVGSCRGEGEAEDRER